MVRTKDGKMATATTDGTAEGTCKTPGVAATTKDGKMATATTDGTAEGTCKTPGVAATTGIKAKIPEGHYRSDCGKIVPIGAPPPISEDPYTEGGDSAPTLTDEEFAQLPDTPPDGQGEAMRPEKDIDWETKQWARNQARLEVKEAENAKKKALATFMDIPIADKKRLTFQHEALEKSKELVESTREAIDIVESTKHDIYRGFSSASPEGAFIRTIREQLSEIESLAKETSSHITLCRYYETAV